jgi:hypothetical protein
MTVVRNQEHRPLVHYEEDYTDHPERRGGNTVQCLKARKAELPTLQAPQKVTVKVTKTKTDKSYAQDEAEVVPLTSGIYSENSQGDREERS